MVISFVLFQRKVVTTLSESFILLDMTGAVKDIRRFNYVKKVRYKLTGKGITDPNTFYQRHIIPVHVVLYVSVSMFVHPRKPFLLLLVLSNFRNDVCTKTSYDHVVLPGNLAT